MKEIKKIEGSSLGRMVFGIVLVFCVLIFVPIEIGIILDMVLRKYFDISLVILPVVFIIYPIFAYIIARLVAVFYNFFAAKWGGVEVVLGDGGGRCG